MEFIKKNFITLTVAAAPLALIGWLFRLISAEHLSHRENIFAGLLLTIFSVLFSWLISHIYFHFHSTTDYSSQDWDRLMEGARNGKNFSQTLNDLESDDPQQSRYNFLKEEIEKLKELFKGTLPSPGMESTPQEAESRNHRKEIKTNCLNCGDALSYQQRPMRNSYKSISCTSCKANFIARWDEHKGFYLEIRKNVLEIFNCPACNKTQRCEIDSLVNSNIIMECGDCKNKIKVYRVEKGLKLFILGNAKPEPIQPKEKQPSPLNQELIRLIRVKKARINSPNKNGNGADLPLAAS